MARELERAVVALVRDILDADCGATPPWLIRPGRRECDRQWGLVKQIYSDLTGRALPDEMPARERREVDCVLIRRGLPPQIFEFDEDQHFNEYRAITLRRYAGMLPVAFDTETWMGASIQPKRLRGGGFGKPRPPLFPEDGGRHRQRAFRDALSDILPPLHGYLPTLRIADFEVRDWIGTNDARVNMLELLRSRPHLQLPA